MASLPSGISEENPYLETVTPINPNTPIGANFMTRFVTQNMASATPWKNANTGLPRSPIAATPRPNMTEKKIMASMSPSAIDWIMFVGTIPTIISKGPSSFTSSVVDTYPEISPCESSSIFTPAPGWNKLAESNPTTIATVVITSK